MIRRSTAPAVALALAASMARASEVPETGLAAAIASDARTARLAARDSVRHPAEVLNFFGVAPNATVVELWPTGGYWTEILAPYLRGAGTLYDALEYQPPDSPGRDAAMKRDAYFADRIAANPALFAGVKLTAFGPDRDGLAPPSSADLILGFRTFHIWMKQGFADDALVDCYKALKPGGILALEDHRGNRQVEQDPKAADGYVNQDWVIGQAELAGFKFIGSSEIEANPKDTADWPRGVYTLAPIFALGDEDRAKYEAIGEPDGFLLKFRKPE